MAFAYIGLGSNLGNRTSYLKKARYEIAANDGVDFCKASTIEETEPVDFFKQPKFLNQIILIKTNILPGDLLNILQGIEKRIGRKNTIEKGPRIIDIDILLYNNITLNTHRLTIPHPEIKNRIFILKHLIELDFELFDPVSGDKYREIYKKCL